MKTLFPSLSVLTLLAGCAAQRPPETPLAPCQRVRIDPAPLWTASAAWTPEQDRLVLIGPGRRSLLVYDLAGRLVREVPLDPLAELDYASPIRLEATRDGYVLGDQTQILWLDRSFHLRRRWRPFEHLQAAGVTAGNLSDFAVVGDVVYAWADFIVAEKGGDDDGGVWHRGFVRLDPDAAEIVPLFELALDAAELDAYYYYGRRPYVAGLGRRPYLLRFTEPPQVLRAARDGVEPLYAAAGDGLEVQALHAHQDRLYVLASRPAEPSGGPELATDAEPLPDTMGRTRLLQIARALDPPAARLVMEIDPASGRVLGRRRLPTEAQQVKVVPGRWYWALIEESSGPNMGGDDVTTLALLPATADGGFSDCSRR